MGLLIYKVAAQIDGIGTLNEIFFEISDRIFGFVNKVVMFIKCMRKFKDRNNHRYNQRRSYPAGISAAKQPN